MTVLTSPKAKPLPSFDTPLSQRQGASGEAQSFSAMLDRSAVEGAPADPAKPQESAVGKVVGQPVGQPVESDLHATVPNPVPNVAPNAALPGVPNPFPIVAEAPEGQPVLDKKAKAGLPVAAPITLVEGDAVADESGASEGNPAGDAKKGRKAQIASNTGDNVVPSAPAPAIVPVVIQIPAGQISAGQISAGLPSPAAQQAVVASAGLPLTLPTGSSDKPAKAAPISAAALAHSTSVALPATAGAPLPIGEATALLRMLTGGGHEARKLTAADGAMDITPAPVLATPSIPVALQQANPMPANLSASLGQQVIDMSSGGQWIDSLAKEIATLSAGTGHGTFRLSPENLGPMRVDIRQGDLGTEVRMTVETEAAQAALVSDVDRLKSDARLTALRIDEVTVDRVQRLPEPGRSDAGTNQGNGNPSPWNQGNGQSGLAQGQTGSQQANNQQAGGQQPGSQQGSRKASSGDAVMSHAEPADRAVDDSQSGLRHARYA